jgi:hypothetical protein
VRPGSLGVGYIGYKHKTVTGNSKKTMWNIILKWIFKIHDLGMRTELNTAG